VLSCVVVASDVTASWGSGQKNWSIVVHGGAGDITPNSESARVEGCKRAVAEAAKVLAARGTALDAAQRAVELLEDDPQFNAGTGACLTRDGTIELDASLMEGTHLRAGAVCALPAFRHPVAIARAALEDGAHILYAGTGAELFAVARGFVRAGDAEMIPPAVRARWEQLRGLRDRDASSQSHGTVGAVARDGAGALAAATSTGGRMFKHPGRVGDSPILGAGTYADDAAGACSNTGDGEAVMRLVLAKTACEWMRSGMRSEDAARAAMQLLRDRTGATGGIILVDRDGRLGLARTTQSMPWAAMAAGWDESAGGA
jgi:L-asparaginase / beta-aspartyl-peptidase